MLNVTDKIDLQRGEKGIALSNLSIYYTWKNMKSSYNNNEFKISAPTWNDRFELPDEPCFLSDIQDYLSMSSYNNNKFKISAPTWNDRFELPDESCFLSDIQDHLSMS